jgi:uncharacterized protein YdhG (YjbR/CyaY superfamily)
MNTLSKSTFQFPLNRTVPYDLVEQTTRFHAKKTHKKNP